MILRYLAGALGRRVTASEASGLVRAACQILNAAFPQLSPRSLDHAIWNHQRTLLR
jgi:hypothetical protein